MYDVDVGSIEAFIIKETEAQPQEHYIYAEDTEELEAGEQEEEKEEEDSYLVDFTIN